MPPEDRTIAALRLAAEPQGFTVKQLMAEAGIGSRLAHRIVSALWHAGMIYHASSSGHAKVWRRT